MRLIFDKESELKNVWEDKLREAAEICLANEGITKYSEISVSFVSEEEIRKLNREYRENDSVTDVLSFPMFEAGELAAMSARVASERKRSATQWRGFLYAAWRCCYLRRTGKETG